MLRKELSRCCRTAIFVALAATAVSGCLSGGEETKTEETSPIEVLSDNELTGSVGDGPVVGAAMRVVAKDGSVLLEFESDGAAGYSVTVRTKGKNYPLTIDARDGVDLVTNIAPDFMLIGAAREPGKKTVANINPFSTFAVEIARELPGGVTKENLNIAESHVIRRLSSGLSTLAESSPMSTLIDSDNVAEIVKSSEALGEAVRRVRDLQLRHGRQATGDSVVQAIASDMTDGVIDGQGGERTDARVSALMTVVLAQVLLESMQNELHVHGADATALLNGALTRIAGSDLPIGLADLPVTRAMLESVRIGLEAILAVSPDQKIRELADALASIEEGMIASQTRTLIPADYRTTLEQSLSVVAAGDEAMISTVNEISYVESTGATPAPIDDTTLPANSAPTISGEPAAEVIANSLYEFVPSASDPDGDPLTFSIAGKPSWATFDAASGRLSGVPGDGDVGIYGDIRIAVSDGTDSASLAVFSISVMAMGMGSVTLNWLPPTENEDGTALTDLAGYRIYWGTSAGNYPNSITIDNPGLTTYVVENLAPGAYEFAATAFNGAGVESNFSAPANKVVQ